MRVVSNIIDDTLKSRGKWSMKRLTILVVLIFTLNLGAFIVLSDLVLKSEVNRWASGIFDSLLIFLATLMGIAEFGKKLTDKSPKIEEE